MQTAVKPLTSRPSLLILIVRLRCTLGPVLQSILSVIPKVRTPSYLSLQLLPDFQFESLSRTLIAQVCRDQKVQCLWDTATDMLAFLKDTKSILDDILASMVSDMMKQIYHNTIFVREYGGEGFFSQSLQA
jgi:hypothetical protein